VIHLHPFRVDYSPHYLLEGIVKLQVAELEQARQKLPSRRHVHLDVLIVHEFSTLPDVVGARSQTLTFISILTPN